MLVAVSSKLWTLAGHDQPSKRVLASAVENARDETSDQALDWAKWIAVLSLSLSSSLVSGSRLKHLQQLLRPVGQGCRDFEL